MLPSEVTQFIKLALDFPHLRLQVRDTRRRRNSRAILVQGEARLGNPVGHLGDRCQLLAQGGFTLVQLGLKVGGLIGIPFRIVQPGCINWKCGFGWRGGRLRCRFRTLLADDPYRRSSRLS